MPNLPISQLPQATTLQGNELFVVVQDGVTKYTTGQDINYITSNNYGLFTQTADSTPVLGSLVTVATSGSLIGTGEGGLSVPANGFKVGDSFHATLSGKLTIANNHKLTINVNTDSVTLASSGELTMAGATGTNWKLELDFIIRNIGSAGTASIKTSGIFNYQKDASDAFQGKIFCFLNNTTFNTTIDNALGVQAVLGSACGPTENIFSEVFILRKVY
jgi:hypothetical protein